MLHHASGMSYIRSIMNDCHREWEPPESASLPSSRFEIARYRRTLPCDWSHEYDRDSRMNTSAHTIAGENNVTYYGTGIILLSDFLDRSLPILESSYDISFHLTNTQAISATKYV